MDPNTINWLWILIGVVLIFAELLIPGAVVIFLGLSAVIVGLLRFMGLIPGLPESIGVWLILSMVLMLALRHLAKRYFPSDTSYKSTDEDGEAFGAIVEVIKNVGDSHNNGRIRFRGTSWSAKSMEGEIEAGTKARIITRDNLAYVIEPYYEDELAEI